METPNSHEKAILVVSDLHVGSIYGIIPSDFVTSDGHQAGMSAAALHRARSGRGRCGNGRA